MSEFNQRDELMKDLQLIKEAVRRNSGVLKIVSLSEGIKLTALLSGLFIFFFGFIILWMEHYYGSYGQIPGTLKLALYLCLGFISVGLVIAKVKGILRVLRKYSQDMNLIKLVQELYAHKILMMIGPYFLSITVLIVYFSVSGLTHLIVPFLAILSSLIFLTFQSFINIRGIMVSFLWLLFSGFVALFFAGSIHSILLLFLTFGVGMIILFGVVQISSTREKRDSVGGK